jgi:GNAT superfamily N-acetyltransferase
MTIRCATRDDTAAIVAMGARFLASTPYGALLSPAAALTPEQLVPFVDLVFQVGAVLVAEVDGVIVGMLGLSPAVHKVSGLAYGSELAWWVDPSARGAGTGKALLEAAESWTRSQGLALLEVSAPAGSEIGRFYERLGYVPVETTYTRQVG